MICADLITLQAGAGTVQVLSPAASQPLDLTTCQAVVLAGADVSTASLFAIPTPTEFGAVWAWGFSLVVVSYLFGWGAGTVLSMLKGR